MILSEKSATFRDHALGALEARFGRMSRRPGVLLQMEDRLLDPRIEALAAGIEIGEDRFAHPGVPEFFDMVGDPRNDLIGALILEELADLVRHIDEAVRRHGCQALRCWSGEREARPSTCLL